MTNVLDNAIERLLQHAKNMTGVNIVSAPNYPIEAAPSYPAVIAYVAGGEFNADTKTEHHNFPVIAVEFHFSRLNLPDSYKKINVVVIDYPRRLVGDATLGGSIDTIVFGKESRIIYSVAPFKYGGIDSQMLRFEVPIKTRQVPIT